MSSLRQGRTIEDMDVLVSAASRHGATCEIAEAIASVLRTRGLDVAVIPPESVDSVEAYDAVVLGSAVYVGHWMQSASQLAARFADALSERPVWLFSSGPVGDPDRKMVQKMGEDPVDLAEMQDRTHAREHRMFAGKLDKQNLTRPQRMSLAVFRGLQGDFRDWEQIERWAARIADSLHAEITEPAGAASND